MPATQVAPPGQSVGVARSFYKGENLGSRPPCAICVGKGIGERAQLVLPFGIRVWLCEAHRSPEFRRRRAGRDFVASLSAVWAAGGCLTIRRDRALEIHRRALLAAYRERGKPGSYAWPDLRREVEARFASGEGPATVVAALLARSGPRPPSRTTVYRWHREARWLGARPRA
jgi:hypothetical protein